MALPYTFSFKWEMDIVFQKVFCLARQSSFLEEGSLLEAKKKIHLLYFNNMSALQPYAFLEKKKKSVIEILKKLLKGKTISN